MVAAVVILVGGCIDPALVPCGDQLCPAGNVCSQSGCATPEQVAACDGQPEESPCGSGAYCVGGACRAPVCGNGIRELGEVCDDGNVNGADGCSAACDSTEICGNELVDLSVGEECDSGLPGLSHDGCTSTCQRELAIWRPENVRELDSRYGHAMATFIDAADPSRDHLVLFGGYPDATAVPTDDMWIWLGAGWKLLTPTLRPAPRAQASMAFDSARKRIVLFGGDSQGGDDFGDTWEWDGTQWLKRTVSVAPSARRSAAMTYDPARNEIVLFGGDPSGGSSSDDETWTWNGTQWTQRSPASRPTARRGAALCFDGTQVVLFGGGGISASAQHTWTWDGTTWTHRSGLSPAPPPRFYASFARDQASGRCVLQGGRAEAATGTPAFEDTWEWTGNAWVQQGSGPARAQSGLAWDPVNQTLMLTGGLSEFGATAQTYVYSAGSWGDAVEYRVTAASREALAYSPPHGYVITRSNNRSFAWDGRQWFLVETAGLSGTVEYASALGNVVMVRVTNLLTNAYDVVAGRLDETIAGSAVGFTARNQFALADDPVRQQLVVFGGVEIGGNTRYDETWLLDLTVDSRAWTKAEPPQRPSPRTAPGLTYDPRLQQLVLFGGATTDGATDDTWTWDGSTWQQLTPATSPSPTALATLATDQRDRLVLLERSASGAMETWTWEGTTWSRVKTVGEPRYMTLFSTAYDATRQRLLLLGQTGDGPETWALVYEAADYPYETCLTDDVDGDGLSGCADPDCWGYCDPLCPPYRDRATCDPGRTRCGDGVCALVEGGGHCEADCPP